MASPSTTAQKIYTVSHGSLMAVRNRMMESAPTIPKEITMLLLIISMITAVIRVIATLVAFILAEYAVLRCVTR